MPHLFKPFFLLTSAVQGQNLACNFDGNNFCQWTNVNSQRNMLWSLNRGSTGTGGTGPSADHTTGSKKDWHSLAQILPLHGVYKCHTMMYTYLV